MTQEEIRAIPAAAVRISKHLDRLRYLKQKSTSVPAMQTSERVQTSAIDRSMVLSDSIIDLEREVAGSVCISTATGIVTSGLIMQMTIRSSYGAEMR